MLVLDGSGNVAARDVVAAAADPAAYRIYGCGRCKSRSVVVSVHPDTGRLQARA
ncbi:MAG: hypothetical protein ACYDAG_04980 [Chloroflexota bacterium]